MSIPVISPGTISRAQAISDLIESVALQEIGISHILTAEGEKIKSIIALPCVTSEQILAVNASVQDTINAITRLEMILQSKLNLFTEDCQL